MSHKRYVWITKGFLCLWRAIRETIREVLDPEFLHYQKCKACGRRDKFDFHFPDKVWESVVPTRLQNRVVCLACFNRFAKMKGINYAPHLIDLCFVGDQASLQLQVVSCNCSPFSLPDTRCTIRQSSALRTAHHTCQGTSANSSSSNRSAKCRYPSSSDRNSPLAHLLPDILPQHIRGSMEKANQIKRKDPHLFDYPPYFSQVAKCNDALGPSPASSTRQTREFHNSISIITAKDVFVKTPVSLGEDQYHGGGGGVRTRVSCGTSSGFKPARFVRSRTPPSLLIVRKHKSIVPIVKSKDKPDILCSVTRGGHGYVLFS